MENPAPIEGKTFGRYRLLEQIGGGEIGSVYRALDVPLDRIVALKMLRTDPPPDSTQVMRFVRGAKAAARLSHPGIVLVHEVGTIDGAHYLTMEFVEGRTLQEMLAGGTLSRERAVEILEKIARAIDYAHSCGVMHRNLKPDNVLIDRQGQPRITDFGLAKSVGTGPQTQRSHAATSYMPPEQMHGDPGEVDNRSDIYSLGAILYEILVGKPPFDNAQPQDLAQRILNSEPERPSRAAPSVPPQLETVVLKAMERDKSQRYASAGELADDLRRYLNGEAVTVRASSGMWRAFSRLRRSWITFIAAAILIVLVAGHFAWGLKKERDARVARELLDRAATLHRDLNIDLESGTLRTATPRARADVIAGLLDEALRLKPDLAEALRRRGAVRAALGRLDEAESDFAAAVAADPASPDARMDLAVLLLREYQILRGRPLAMVGRSGETFELLAAEPPVARTVADRAVEAFRAAEGRLTRPEDRALAAAALAALDRNPRWGDAVERAAEAQRLGARKPETALLLSIALASRERTAPERARAFSSALSCRTALSDAPRLDALTPFSADEVCWALGRYDRAIVQGDATPETRINRATILVLLRRYAAARQDLSDALESRPDDPEALARLAALDLSERKLDDALAGADRLVAAAPAAAPGYVLRALARIEKMIDPKQAARDAEEGEHRSPGDPFASYVLARARLDTRDFDGAAPLAGGVTTALPDFYHAWDALAEAKLRNKDVPGAQECISRCFGLRSDYWRAHQTQGRIRCAKGLDDEAIGDFGAALRYNPDAVLALVWRGRAKLARSNTLEAVKDYDDAVARRPDLVQPRLYRGYAWAVLKEEAKAKQDCAWVMEKAADDPEANLMLAETFSALGDYGGTVDAAEKARKLDPRLSDQADRIIRNAQQMLRTQPPEWRMLLEQAEKHVRSTAGGGDITAAYRQARPLYEKAFKLLEKKPALTHDDKIVIASCLYNYSCTVAFAAKAESGEERKGDVDLALRILRDSLSGGFARMAQRCATDRKEHTGVEHMLHDSDFEAIRDDPRFKKLAEEFTPKPEEFY